MYRNLSICIRTLAFYNSLSEFSETSSLILFVDSFSIKSFSPSLRWYSTLYLFIILWPFVILILCIILSLLVPLTFFAFLILLCFLLLLLIQFILHSSSSDLCIHYGIGTLKWCHCLQPRKLLSTLSFLITLTTSVQKFYQLMNL